jgi:hypothetical protein
MEYPLSPFVEYELFALVDLDAAFELFIPSSAISARRSRRGRRLRRKSVESHPGYSRRPAAFRASGGNCAAGGVRELSGELGRDALHVPRWYRLLSPIRPGNARAGTMRTVGTLVDASTYPAARLGAERSSVQIRPPRLAGGPLSEAAFRRFGPSASGGSVSLIGAAAAPPTPPRLPAATGGARTSSPPRFPPAPRRRAGPRSDIDRLRLATSCSSLGFLISRFPRTSPPS